MASCGVSGCPERAEKNVDMVTERLPQPVSFIIRVCHPHYMHVLRYQDAERSEAAPTQRPTGSN